MIYFYSSKAQKTQIKKIHCFVSFKKDEIQKHNLKDENQKQNTSIKFSINWKWIILTLSERF